MPKLFGTNGVRGIVNQDMNVDLAIRLGKAIGTWLDCGKVLIGTDTRLSNQMLKNAVCSALTATGCDVIDVGEVPTPAIQMYTRDNTDLGIVITASHNPPQFNGIKCIDGDGTELIRWKEKEIEKIYFSEDYDLANWSDVGKISSDEANQSYMEAVKAKVDKSKIEKADLKVIVDCANGAGCYTMPYILKDLGCDVITLNAQPDGTFPGHDSEPTEENLKDLIRLVKETDADLGIANDGDADRAIFIDESGRYLHGDKTLTLVAKKVVKDNDGGMVVTPVSSSTSVEDVVEESGGELIYTKVGSPIVAREMIEKGALFGGEENGGLIFAGHQYCRDAGLTAAKIVEMIASDGPLSELVDDLPNYALDKRGVACPDEMKVELMERLKKKFDEEEYDDIDGLKIYYDEGWVLIRPSGTEPKYRVYSEAKDVDIAEKLGDKHQKIVKRVLEDIR
ncbi:MAG: phosphoglucosamine mutase [Candidatus Saliniplasma sp.]